MRVILQRVRKASVAVENKLISEIGNGLLLLLGVEHQDEESDIQWLTQKISQLRIFSDSDGRMNLNIDDVEGDVIVVSQFTLHASTKKGNRPSFMKAAEAQRANQLYEAFIQALSQQINGKVLGGEFGALMDVKLVNHGPVTLFIDSKNRE